MLNPAYPTLEALRLPCGKDKQSSAHVQVYITPIMVSRNTAAYHPGNSTNYPERLLTALSSFRVEISQVSRVEDSVWKNAFFILNFSSRRDYWPGESFSQTRLISLCSAQKYA